MNNILKASTSIVCALTAQEVLEKAKLNWSVKKETLHLSNGTTVDGHYAITRTDTGTPIGVVGEVYRPYSNHDLVVTLESLVMEKLASFKYGYCWEGGAKVGVVAEIPQHLYVLGKDELAVQITARNSFDGSSPVGYSIDVLRVVCTNGLKRFIKKSFITARHCSSTNQKLIQSREILGLAVSSIDGVLAQAETMARTRVNADMVEQFLSGLSLNKIEGETAQRENKRMELLRTFDAGIGLSDPAYKHSVWSLYNAATEVVDHRGGVTDSEKKAVSAEYGAGSKFKISALDQALQLVR